MITCITTCCIRTPAPQVVGPETGLQIERLRGNIVQPDKLLQRKVLRMDDGSCLQPDDVGSADGCVDVLSVVGFYSCTSTGAVVHVGHPRAQNCIFVWHLLLNRFGALQLCS
jgi:hypothetical protein